MRALIVVTHLLGIGHLARAAALGRAMARGGHAVTLATGGRPAPVVDMAGIDVVQLPPLHVRGTDFRTLFGEDGAVASEALMRARRDRLCDAARRTRPDAVVIELFPFGRRQLAGEFQSLLQELAALRPRPVVLSSIRDVLAPPSTPQKAAFADETLAAHFDGVLVHGDRTVLPLETSWPVSTGLARVLRYTGYIAEAAAPTRSGEGSGDILVSGGGSESSLPILEAALGAARLLPGRRWRLLAGQGLPQSDFAQLGQEAPDNAGVERARPDFPQLLAGAACSVSQAGYNTMLDLVGAAVPAVVVPFERGGEREQAIRAERFASLGLVRIVRECDLTPQALADAVRGALSSGRPQAPTIDVAGAVRSIALVDDMMAERHALDAAWSRLEAVLDRCADEGRIVRFWWRDDDAVAPTPALDRLLALARRLGLPLSLAVIPGQVTPALAQRLADEEGIAVLVHGIAHRNNAAAPAKKQELVAADDATLAALRHGREWLRALFGARALPVLVPPWNRIDPALAARLPEAGFVGLSTFSTRLEEGKPGGSRVFSRVDTHVDPIDWRGGGGIVRAPAHIAALAGMLENQLAHGPPELGPVGVLTHHLVHDAWIWNFVRALLERLDAHRAVRFEPAGLLFGLT